MSAATTDRLQELADRLHAAAGRGEAIAPLREELPAVEDAYRVQGLNVQRARDAGRRVVGRKVGLTSVAMQQMLGVDEPDFGVLFDDMVLDDGADLEGLQLIAPRVEAEISFVLGRDLAGPGVTTVDALRATEAVVASLEVIDSRIREWDIRLVDTIADNASAAACVLGPVLHDPAALDLRLLGVAMSKNGAIVGSGCGAAALGHPAACVAWLANKLAAFGERLEAGAIVMSGALHGAVDLVPGDVVYAEFAGLGGVRAHWSTPTP